MDGVKEYAGLVKSPLMQRPVVALLKKVSRTFFLSMNYLPREMRGAVCVAYLLARATDTVADARGVPEERRGALLTVMNEAVGGRLGSDELRGLAAELKEMRGVEHAGERELLACFDVCLAALNSLPDGVCSLARRVLGEIIEGQRWDIMWFRDHSHVADAEQTRLYCYRVAGCVGEFWTRLGLLELGDRFSGSASDELLRLGIRYGQGLQMVNIMRDLAEDAERGRCYLPEGARAETWLRMARQCVNEGLDYASKLRGWRVRFASGLPARLALKTLDAMNAAKHAGNRKVKISRGSVYCSCFSCLFAAVFGSRR